MTKLRQIVVNIFPSEWAFIAQILSEGRLKVLNMYLCQMVFCSLRHLSSLCSFFDQNFILKLQVFLCIRRAESTCLTIEEKNISL